MSRSKKPRMEYGQEDRVTDFVVILLCLIGIGFIVGLSII